MTLRLGEKIKALRKEEGKTQEELAGALGITCQAVSRWELNAAYPDMELIPAIANYFGITIDELFGYECDRGKKIDEIIANTAKFNIRARSDDEWIEECLTILRQGIAEFPNNEKLLITLAETLSEAGWRRHGQWQYYDDEGYIRLDHDRHKTNNYWKEAVIICENLVNTTRCNETFTRAVNILVLLYCNMGETEKASHYAECMPSLAHSREIMLAASSDGKRKAEYTGKALLELAAEFSRQLIQGLIANIHNYESDMPIEKINGLISMFYLVCEDGNFGEYHGEIIKLYLYLSAIQWERGYHDEAFVSLDKALEHAKQLEALLDGKEHKFTAALVSNVKCKSGEPVKIAASLPEDWYFWRMPKLERAETEMKEDKRWKEWVERARG